MTFAVKLNKIAEQLDKINSSPPKDTKATKKALEKLEKIQDRITEALQNNKEKMTQDDVLRVQSLSNRVTEYTCSFNNR